MKAVPRSVATALVSMFVLCGSLRAADWPGFRGPKGGVADDRDLPVELTKDNVLWKVKLPGPGTSSPITAGDKIYLTCYSGYGTTLTKGFSMGGFKKGGKGDFKKGGKGGSKKGGFGGFGGFGGPDTGGDQKKLRLHVLCLDRASGEVMWKKDLQPKLPEKPFSGMLREHGYASSTPTTDGERVYAFFGKTGVFAFDLAGKQLWQVDVGTGSHMWGSAASPVLYKDLVIVFAAVESRSLLALDKKTGKEVWRVKGINTSWASPLLVETKEGKHEVVLSLSGKIAAYDPATGKQLWHCQGIGSASDEGEGGFVVSASGPIPRRRRWPGTALSTPWAGAALAGPPRLPYGPAARATSPRPTSCGARTWAPATALPCSAATTSAGLTAWPFASLLPTARSPTRNGSTTRARSTFPLWPPAARSTP